jgi:hypothetical protein
LWWFSHHRTVDKITAVRSSAAGGREYTSWYGCWRGACGTVAYPTSGSLSSRVSSTCCAQPMTAAGTARRVGSSSATPKMRSPSFGDLRVRLRFCMSFCVSCSAQALSPSILATGHNCAQGWRCPSVVAATRESSPLSSKPLLVFLLICFCFSCVKDAQAQNAFGALVLFFAKRKVVEEDLE